MKTEDFDDAIRRKVESINYSFTEKDIDRTLHYSTSKNSIQSLWQGYGVFSLFCLLGLSIAGLLYVNHHQLQEQKLLVAKFDSLQKNFEQIKHYTLSAQKRDTVFIVKYLSREEYDMLEENNTNSLIKGKNKQLLVEQNLDNENGYKNTNKYSKKSITGNDVLEANAKHLFYDKHKTKNKYNSKNGENLNEEALDNAEIVNSKTIEQSHRANIYQAIHTSNASMKDDSTFKQQALLENNTQTIKTDSTLVIDSLPKLEKDDSQRKNLTKNKKTKNHLSLKNLQYQAGLGLEKANTQFGIGIMGELFFSKRFSINVGFKYLNINNHFRDSDDFNKQTNKDFYAATSQFADTFNIANIAMNYNILQIPVAFNYSIPLKNDFAFLSSVGTDLDISTNLNVKYQEVVNYSKDIEKNTSLNVQYHPVLFNNMVLAIGLQKQWNHIILQASPFISPQLKIVDYKQDNLYGGLRIRAFYKF